MKTSTTTTENDNLVLFPSAKNYKAEKIMSDPMVDLMNEYSELVDSDIPESLGEIITEDDFDDDSSIGSLDAFMNRHQSEELLTPDDKLVKLINEKVEAIAVAKERIKFYLDEIEMFLPRRR
jgi:hypothetical protein